MLALDPFPVELRRQLHSRSCRDVVDTISAYCHPEGPPGSVYHPGPLTWEDILILQVEEELLLSPFTLPRSPYEWHVGFLLLRLASSQVFIPHHKYNQRLAQIPKLDFTNYRSPLLSPTAEEAGWLQQGYDIYLALKPIRPKTPVELIWAAGSKYFLTALLMVLPRSGATWSKKCLFHPFPRMEVQGEQDPAGLIEKITRVYLDLDLPVELKAMSYDVLRQAWALFLVYKQVPKISRIQM